MELKEYLIEQIEKHPAIQPRDVVKLCYQAAFGAEHLLSDIERARTYFYSEYDSVEASDGVLYEEISPEVCRVNLPAWKAGGMPAEWLFRMFAHSASVPHGSRERFLGYLETADEVQRRVETAFSDEEWKEFLEEYKAAGMSAVHHSREYREAEHPSYRIINRKYLSLFPVLRQAANLQTVNQSAVNRQQDADESRSRVIALDGRAASGKSTMAGMLEEILEAGVIHMDDFFLPPALRTDARFAEPGGNVHYERFAEEVLPKLKSREAFSYRVFDCGIMDYHGKREVAASEWRVVEGSYSMHPAFGNYADLSVFLDVSGEEQMNRILARNGEEMAAMFSKRWIPLEETYFAGCQVRERAQLVFGEPDK
ncbi:MAG: hypothetical protein IJ468_12825 [Lachnospiraceae bacterium]|nr:hypothetical protein [Lachnospiraceae bacterium]